MKETNGQLDIYVLRVGGRNSANLTAGELLKKDGSPEDLAIFTLADSHFRRLEVPLAGIWSLTVWLSDSQRLLFRDRRGIFLLNTAGGAPQELVSVGGYYIGRSLGITADNRIITYSETATEGDIWMVDLGSANVPVE